MATKPQQQLIGSLFQRKLSMDRDEEKLVALTEWLGRDITTAADLTFDEAQGVHQPLQHDRGGAHDPTMPTALGPGRRPITAAWLLAVVLGCVLVAVSR